MVIILISEEIILMKRKINLPSQLKYLEPAIKELSKVPPDELDEMTNTDLLVKLLLKRIDGINDQQADMLLNEDRNLLEQWTKDNPDQAGPAIFIFGFMMGSDAEAMRDASQAKPSETIIQAQFPKGFKTDRPNDYCINGQKRKIVICVGILPQKSSYEHLKTHHTAPDLKIEVPGCKKEYKKTISTITYGKVRGYKVHYVQTAFCFWKRVEYLLEVPGGYATVMIDSGGKDFNEMEYEPFLESINIIKNPGA
jgi:hypothetical protein